MSGTNHIGQKGNPDEVRALLRELSQQLLAWSWEGVVGYEEMVERVGRTYGYEDTTVAMEAQLAMIKLEPDEEMTFVKGGIPGFPPMAYTQDLKNLLADIYAGKLSVDEARKSLKTLHDKEPPYPPFLNWLGVVIVSIGFAVDVVGTWEGLLWAGITGMATGVPPQNPVGRTIVDVSAPGIKLAYPDASLAVRPARDRQIEPEAAARARYREPRLATAAGHCAAQDQAPQADQSGPCILGRAVASVARLAERADPRETPDRDRLASQGLQALLELEEPKPRRTSTDRRGDPDAHPSNGP